MIPAELFDYLFILVCGVLFHFVAFESRREGDV